MRSADTKRYEKLQVQAYGEVRATSARGPIRPRARKTRATLIALSWMLTGLFALFLVVAGGLQGALMALVPLAAGAGLHFAIAWAWTILESGVARDSVSVPVEDSART